MTLLLALAAAGLVPETNAPHFRPPAHRAQANLAELVSDSDYPPSAIRSGEQGIVRFALDVDTVGRVSACRIIDSSGSATLDEVTCRILRERARFTPARDRRGRAVPDQVVQRIRWILPQEPNPAPQLANPSSYISDTDYPADALRRGEQGRVEYQLTIAPEGRVSACSITRSSGSASLDRATCLIMRTRARFQPAHDDHGNPVPDTVNGSMNWVLPN